MVADIPLVPLAVVLVAGLVALAAFSLGERLAPLRKRREPWLRHAARNVATVALAQAVSTPVRLLIVTPVAAAVTARGWGLLGAFDLPLPAEIVLGLVLLDGSLWAWHVLNHRVPLLWRFHAVHHADLDLDATTALRFHFGELALSVLYRALQVLVLGVGPGLLALWELLTLLATLFHHSNLRLPPGVDRAIARLVPTPRMHGIHHSVVREERNSNYGILLTLWDVAFRTLRLDVPQERIVIGLPELQEPGRVRWGTLQAMPFRRGAGGFRS